MQDKKGALVTIERDGNVFTVEPKDGGGYAGFFNGVESVTSDDPAVALRGLYRKHIVGLPEGALIDFADAAARLRAE